MSSALIRGCWVALPPPAVVLKRMKWKAGPVEDMRRIWSPPALARAGVGKKGFKEITLAQGKGIQNIQGAQTKERSRKYLQFD
jgi:hypothetical protein